MNSRPADFFFLRPAPQSYPANNERQPSCCLQGQSRCVDRHHARRCVQPRLKGRPESSSFSRCVPFLLGCTRAFCHEAQLATRYSFSVVSHCFPGVSEGRILLSLFASAGQRFRRLPSLAFDCWGGMCCPSFRPADEVVSLVSH